MKFLVSSCSLSVVVMGHGDLFFAHTKVFYVRACVCYNNQTLAIISFYIVILSLTLVVILK
jgi:hypothetical protein